MFGFALHLFVTKLQAPVVIDYPWCNLASYAFRGYVHLASYAFSRWASFGVKCSKGLITNTRVGDNCVGTVPESTGSGSTYDTDVLPLFLNDKP